MSDSDHIDAIDTTVQKTYTWLRELCAEHRDLLIV